MAGLFPVVGFLAAIFPSHQPSPQVPESLVGVHKIVCLGDSITQQGGNKGGYVWLLDETLRKVYPQAGIQVVNAGISGNKSPDMLARYQHDVLDQHPDLLTISVGVNDVWHGFYDGHADGEGPLRIPLPEYNAHVEEMVDRALAQHVKVVLLSATVIMEDVDGPMNKKAEPYNLALEQVASSRHLTFINLQKPFRELISTYRRDTGSQRNCLTVDGVHMTPLGNQVMAQTILTALGVPASDRLAVDRAVMDDMVEKESMRDLPAGFVVSDHCLATASSSLPGCEPANATIPLSAGPHQPWCGKDGDYSKQPWWQVDLGTARNVTGIQIFFHPSSERDVWHYRVEGSADGSSYATLVENSDNTEEFNQSVHIFTRAQAIRYVRILFTKPTKASNWPAIRSCLVFAKVDG